MPKISDKTKKFFIQLELFVLGATFYWDGKFFPSCKHKAVHYDMIL